MPYEALVRLAPFGVILAACWIAESLAPDRQMTGGAYRLKRWGANAGLFLIGAGLARMLAPAGVTGAALWAQSAGVGLFNAVDAPAWAVWALCLLALDAAMYGQHRAMHRFGWAWRLHAPHHADIDLDTSSGLRFHPGEYLLSLVWKAGVAVALGAPPEAVLAFEIALNGFSLFMHANVRLPPALDRALSRVVFTPRSHRLHHDLASSPTSGNYGFSLTLWDRLMGTYVNKPEPEALGLATVDATAAANLGVMLTLPVRSERIS